jgi:hypothetical protein
MQIMQARDSFKAPDQPANMALPALLNFSRLTVSIKIHDVCWNVYVCPHADPDQVWAVLVETRPEEPPQLVSLSAAPATWDGRAFFTEAARYITDCDRV